MSAQSWFPSIQGLTTLLTGSGQTTQRRSTLKVIGSPVFDDGTQTVLGGVQTIVGSGAWDTKSGLVLVTGSGARTITLSDPDPTLRYAGLQILIAEAAGQAGIVTIDPSGNIGTSASNVALAASAYTFQYLMWLAVGQWMKV